MTGSSLKTDGMGGLNVVNYQVEGSTIKSGKGRA